MFLIFHAFLWYVLQTAQKLQTEVDDCQLTDIWKTLECPVCMEIVTPPVNQCELGHHVCYDCWNQIPECPLCKGRRMEIRNFVAEAMVEKIPLPCKYRMDGCNIITLPNDRRAHEETCEYRSFKCLVQSCDKISSAKYMLHHMQISHGSLLRTNRGYVFKYLHFSSPSFIFWLRKEHRFFGILEI